MSTLLRVNNLSGGYTKAPVIKNVSFDVRKGDFLGIIGPNGSGKSTLLRLISKVLHPQEGSIVFEDKDITKIKLKELCRKIAFVPQETLINFSFTVWEIVLLGRTPHLKRLQFESSRDLVIAKDALLSTDSLQLEAKQINQLSAGERQRVIIAKALAQEPILLLLDEPTSHLDIGHQIQILDLLKRLNSQTNLSIVIVLHDLNLASEYCNKLILLDQGRISKEGKPSEVLTYQNIEAAYKTTVVVKENPISAKPYVVLVSKENKCRQD